MQPITLLLVERTPADLARTGGLLMQNPAFQIIGQCTNVRQAHALIQLHYPDVVLCEMILNGADGLSLLRRLPQGAVKPLFIMTSGLASDCVLRNACNLGADYFVLKPIEPFHLEQTIRALARPADDAVPPDGALLPQIHRLLIAQGFSSRYQGFRYLATALQLLYSNPSLMGSLTKALYVRIAEIHSTLPTRVERDIRHAVHRVCERAGVHPLSNGSMLRQLNRLLRQQLSRR